MRQSKEQNLNQLKQRFFDRFDEAWAGVNIELAKIVDGWTGVDFH